MNDYWQLSERERAALTEEQVKTYEAYELMAAGVVRTASPGEFTHKRPDVGKRNVFVINTKGYNSLDVAFPTMEDAHAFVTSRAMCLSHEYDGNESTLAVRPLDGAKIEIREVCVGEDIDRCKSEWDRYRAAKRAHEDLATKHEKAQREEANAVHGLWKDWEECGRKALVHKRVVDTWEEYRKIAGDDATAAKFLAKAYSTEAVEDAAEWFGIEIAGIGARAEAAE